MKKILISINFILFLSPVFVYGQYVQTVNNIYTQEDFNFSIPVNSNSNLPTWAKFMYENPSELSTIKELYDNYYLENTFEKNQHTQYFKRLSRAHTRVNQDYTLSIEEMEKKSTAYIHKRNASNLKSTAQWEAIGPTNIDIDAAVSGNTPGTAHVRSLGFCYGQETNILAATATAGIWKSTDDGQSWTAITNDLPVSSVASVAFKPNDPSVMYFQASSNFYKSTNGGASWYETGGSEIVDLVFNANTIITNNTVASDVYLATNKGFFKSSDEGENFTKTLTGLITDIVIHPTNNQIIYVIKSVSNRTEFYRSDDGGDSFTLYDNGYPQPSSVDENKRTVLAVSADEPDAVYALAVGKMNGGDGLVGVYKSVNKGEGWGRRCCGDSEGGPASSSNPNIMEWNCGGTQNGGQYYYDLAIAVNPNNIDEVITGGINLWSSNDGGNTMNCLSDYIYGNMEETYVHADIHDIKYINGNIWIASDGGIFRSTDNAQTFHKRMNGLHGTDFRGFDVSFFDKNVMLGGTYHNGTMLREGSTYNYNWVSTRSGDNARSTVNKGKSSLIYDHSGIRKLTGDRLIAPKNENLFKKPNASLITGESSEIVFDPNNYNTFYLGNGSSLWKTKDNGVTFEEVENFGNGLVTSIEISPLNSDLIYLVHYPSYGGTKNIKRTMDGGNTWVDITVPASLYDNENAWITFDIAAGSTSHMSLWAVRTTPVASGINLDGNSVFFSADAGTTWQNITPSDLDGEYPTNIVHQEGTNDVIYIGTRRAVYSKVGSNWDIMSNGLPMNTFSTKLVPHYTSGKLINATQRGLFEVDLSASSAMALPMVSQTYSNCLRDTFYFKDRSPVGSNYSRVWTFTGADNTSSTSKYPKVTYSTAGVYPVKLEITGPNGSFVYESLDFIEVEDGCSIEPTVGNGLTTGSAGFAKVPAFDKELSEMTISAWVKRSGPIYNNAGVITHRDGIDGTGLFVNAQGFLVGQWDELTATAISTLQVPYNKWAFVAMTVAVDGITLYVDGQSEFFSKAISPVLFEDFTCIGTDEFAPSNYFPGFIDEIKFYDIELSPEEIQKNMNLTASAGETGLFAYYQANNTSGKLMDRVGNNHGFIINNSTRVPSLASVSGGCSELVDIYGPGTYDFDCAGVSLTFEPGDVVPQGPVSISKLDELPGMTLPSGNTYSNGYWVFNNFGVNQSISAPKNVEISDFGNANSSLINNPEYYNAFMVPTYWEYGWGSSADQADEMTLVDNGTIIFDELEAMTYFGKLVISEDGSQSLSAWEVEMNAHFIVDHISLEWSGIGSYLTYELLKSDNGKDFYTIDTGNAEHTSYTLIDNELASDILYYKIKLYDENGDSSESEITAVSVPKLDDVKIFPNVVAPGNTFNVHIGDRQNLRFRVYDLEGRLIKDIKQDTQLQNYALDLNAGQYAVEFISNQEVETQFLIVQ